MADIADKILKAIEIIIDKKLGQLGFDRTVDGKIIEKTEKGYLVAIEGNKVNVKLYGSAVYEKGDIVKVRIPQNNINQAYIENPQIDYSEKFSDMTTSINALRIDSSKDQVIGTWFGKTVYRKCIEHVAVSVGATSWGTICYITPNARLLRFDGTYGSSSQSTIGRGSYQYVTASGAIQVYNGGSNAATIGPFYLIIDYVLN